MSNLFSVLQCFSPRSSENIAKVGCDHCGRYQGSAEVLESTLRYVTAMSEVSVWRGIFS